MKVTVSKRRGFMNLIRLSGIISIMVIVDELAEYVTAET